jgi:hypothetical protein
MESLIIQDFALSVRLGSCLLRQSVASGETVPIGEILSLAAQVEALSLFATLESRKLQRTKDCHELWSEVACLFDELWSVWVGVDSDQNIHWLCSRLELFRTQAIEQTQLYEIRASERRRHALCREDASPSFGQRNESTPNGWRDQSSPAHVYTLGYF